MKLLPDTGFETLSNLTSSGADASFPVSNVATMEPMQRWHADAYAGDVWIKWDFGGAVALTGLFLNQCNFPHAHFQAADTDDWTTPPVDVGLDLVLDDAGNRKGFFTIASTRRWCRLLIPGSQTLDNSETVPAVGNLIAGSPSDMTVSDFSADLTQAVRRFETTGGAVSQDRIGRARHILSVSVANSRAVVRAIPKNWDHAVFAADIGDAGEAWFVLPPSSWPQPIRNLLDAQLRVQLEEKP